MTFGIWEIINSLTWDMTAVEEEAGGTGSCAFKAWSD